MITSTGDLTSGIKSRLWTVAHGGSVGVSPTSAADYNTVSNWLETTNTACYTHASETATTCGTGLAPFSTNTKFALNGTSDSHTAVADWFTGITGQTFTSVNVDSDTQY